MCLTDDFLTNATCLVATHNVNGGISFPTLTGPNFSLSGRVEDVVVRTARGSYHLIYTRHPPSTVEREASWMILKMMDDGIPSGSLMYEDFDGSSHIEEVSSIVHA